MSQVSRVHILVIESIWILSGVHQEVWGSVTAKWRAADDANLIQVLTDQQAVGNQADNAWKGSLIASKLGNHWQRGCTDSK
jgi:hypothetical protein